MNAGVALASLLLWLSALPTDIVTTSAVVIYGGSANKIDAAEIKGQDIWVTPADLKRATRFEMKPEGMCTDKLCIPLPASRKSQFIVERSGKTWFNLSEFARLLKQPAVHDAIHKVWFFGPRPEEQDGYLDSLAAPDFSLPDLNGKSHSLSDYRGKKVLLITWGSW